MRYSLLLILLLSISAFAQRPVCGKNVDSLIAFGDRIRITKVDSSAHYFYAAQKLAQNCNDSLGLAKAGNFIGLCHYQKGEYEEATEEYFEALGIAERNGHTKDQGMIMNNLGALYLDLQNYEQSEYYFNGALDIMTELQDSVWLSKIYTNLAGLAFSTQNYELSIELLEMSRDLAIQLQLFETVGGSVANLAIVYSSLGNMDAAFEAYDWGIYVLDSVGDQRGLCITLQEKGKALANHGYYKEALNTYHSSLKLAKEIYHLESVVKCYDGLSKLEEENGNLTAALNYQQSYISWKDSLLKRNNQKNIDELHIQYQSEKQKEKIAFLNKESALKDQLFEKNEKEKNYIIILLALLTILVGVFIYLLYRRKKTTLVLQQKNSAIENALKERELLVKEVHHRVKNNLQIVSSMLNIHANTIRDEKMAEVLLESRKRVQSMSTVHQQLYRLNDVGKVNFSDYANHLIEEIESQYDFELDCEIKVKRKLENIELSSDQTIQLGLILSELMTNAYKHAFSGMQSGEIAISFFKGDGKWNLQVNDNGCGIGEKEMHKSESFGIKLINSLCRSLNANCEWKSAKGTIVSLTFEL